MGVNISYAFCQGLAIKRKRDPNQMLPLRKIIVWILILKVFNLNMQRNCIEYKNLHFRERSKRLHTEFSATLIDYHRWRRVSKRVGIHFQVTKVVSDDLVHVVWKTVWEDRFTISTVLAKRFSTSIYYRDKFLSLNSVPY